MRLAVAAVIAALLGCTKKNIRECEGNQNCTAEPGGVCRTYAETGSRWCSYPDPECESGYRWGDVTVGDELADTCVQQEIPSSVDAVPCDEQISWLRSGDIWIGNLDGSSQQNLTESIDDESHHQWSADGQVVAYERPIEGTTAIWRMNRDGSAPMPLTEGADILPKWASDGSTIAFLRSTTNLAVWQVPASGGVAMKLSEGSRNDFSPEFSPDGSRIAYASALSGDSEIWLMESDGTNPIPLTAVGHILGTFEKIIDWAPDGNRLLFVAEQPRDIWAIDIDGSNAANLTDGLGNVLEPEWLSDGRVLFQYGGALWAMNNDGTGQSMLIEAASDARVSGDRTRIAFVRSGDTWIADADGTNQVRITTDGGELPQWVGCPE